MAAVPTNLLYLTGSLHHEGSVGLDIQSEGFNDCTVMKTDAEIWERDRRLYNLREKGICPFCPLEIYIYIYI